MAKKSAHNNFTDIITLGSTLFFIIFVLTLVGSLIWHSMPSIKRFGFSFLTSTTWNTKFLELNTVRLHNNTFILNFTTTLLDSNTSNITLTYNQQHIPFETSTEGRSIIVSPDQLLEGTYTLILSKKILDSSKNPLLHEVTWSGTINSDGKLIRPKITRNDTGEIYRAIQDENERHFGIIAFIVGTILSSLLALCMAFPIAMASALYLTEYSHPKSKSAKLFAILIDLLAGIPSVIYGLWALFFLVPTMGANLFTASLVLAIMTIPYATSLTREAISLVPKKLRDAGLGLGASQFQVITKIILPYARSGIIAGVLLTLGRALGETLAVTMVIGNRNQIPSSIFQPAQTIASLIANEYGESSGLKQSALIEAGFVLIIITLIFSLLGRFIIRWVNREKKEA